EKRNDPTHDRRPFFVIEKRPREVLVAKYHVTHQAFGKIRIANRRRIVSDGLTNRRRRKIKPAEEWIFAERIRTEQGVHERREFAACRTEMKRKVKDPKLANRRERR